MKASVQTRAMSATDTAIQAVYERAAQLQGKTAIAAVKQSLSNVARKSANAKLDAEKLGLLMAEVGETIGLRDVDAAIGKSETIETIQSLLGQMMQAGLTCDKDCPTGDMLKAPSKTNPGELWTVFVDAINAPRIAADLPEIAKTARDNYLSRIRAYVRDRGNNPLDLYGNLQAAKLAAAKKSAKTASEPKNGAGEGAGSGKPSEAPVGRSDASAPAHTESLKGVAPLVAFLSKYLAENPKKSAAGDFLEVLALAEDVLDAAQDVFKAESQRKAKK